MRRRHSAIAATFTLTAGLLAGAIAAGVPNAAAATYDGSISNGFSWCLGILGSSTASGADAEQGACSSSSKTQTWHVRATIVDKTAGITYYQFENGVDMCLGVSGASDSAGALVVQETCSSTTNHSQFWSMFPNYYVGGDFVQNYHSGQYLGIQGGNDQSGALVVQGPNISNGDPSVDWFFNFTL